MESKKKTKSFVQNVLKLMSGNLLAQIITIALMPVITRIYSSSDYGTFSVVVAFAMIFVPISCLRYNAAIVIAEDDEDASTLVYLSLGINVCIVLFLLLIISNSVTEISLLLDLTSEVVIWFIPLIIFLSGLRLILEAWSTRQSMFNQLALSTIANATVDRGIGIALGLIGAFNHIGLLVSRLLGILSSLFLLPPVNLTKKKIINKDNFLKMHRRYRHFSRYSLTAILQQFPNQAPIILLAILYTPSIAGFYALSTRVLAEPIQIVGAAIGRSFLHRASQEQRGEKQLAAITLTLFKYLLKIIAVPLILFSLVSPEIFSFVFGDEWSVAGKYVQYMVPVFIINFLMRPLGSLFDVLEKQKEQFNFSMMIFIGTSAAFSLGFIGLEVEDILLIFTILMTAILGSRVVWILRQVGISLIEIAEVFITVAKSGALVIIPVSLILNSIDNSALASIFVVGLAIALYLYVALWRDVSLRKKLLGN